MTDTAARHVAPCCAQITTTQFEDLVTSMHELAEAVRALAEQALRDPDALLTAEQLGQLLAIPSRTVKDQAAAGVIPHRRLGKHYRFSRDDLAEIIRLTGRVARPRSGRLRVA